MPGMHAFLSHNTVPRALAGAALAAALALALTATQALAQWPTTCVELNDIVEARLGNSQNVGIYQRVFGDRAEQACQNDHRADVQSTFAWAISTPVPMPAPAPAPSSAPAPPPVAAPAPPPAPMPGTAPIGEVLHVVPSPFVAQDRTIWLGTSTGGVLRSDNAGASFTQFIQGMPNLAVNAILPSPNLPNDSVVLVATNNGVARSTDRGQTWTAVAGLPAGRIGGLAASWRFETDRLFYAVADAGGLYLSNDGGSNWSGVPVVHANGLARDTYLGLTTTEGRGRESHVFAWTSTQILGSETGGRGFNSVPADKALPSDLRISTVAVHPDWRHNGILWVGSELHGLYRTDSGGKDFDKVLENPSNQLGRINAIAMSPLISRDGTVLVGTAKMGVFKSRKTVRQGNVADPGGHSNWLNQSVNLRITNVRGVAFSNAFQENQTIYAGGDVRFAFTTSGAIDWYTYPDPVGPIG